MYKNKIDYKRERFKRLLKQYLLKLEKYHNKQNSSK